MAYAPACRSIQKNKPPQQTKPSFINLKANRALSAPKEKPFLIPTAEVEFNIPPEYLEKRNKHSEILFICRLNLQGSDFYPLNYKNQKRFLGVRTKTHVHQTDVKGHHNSQSDSTLFRSNVSIDTIENLMNNEIWSIYQKNT